MSADTIFEAQRSGMKAVYLWGNYAKTTISPSPNCVYGAQIKTSHMHDEYVKKPCSYTNSYIFRTKTAAFLSSAAVFLAAVSTDQIYFDW